MNFYTEVEEALGGDGNRLILSGLEDIAAGLGQKSTNRVTSLDNGVELASSGVIEAVGKERRKRKNSNLQSRPGQIPHE